MSWILFVLAWLSFVLGIIGVFVPILPTTPFLILSAYLFSKSSPRFHAWILALPMAGPAIKDWRNTRVIKLRAKVLCAVMILISLFVILGSQKISPYLKLPVTLLLVGVGAFVVTRKSYAIPTAVKE